MPILKLQPRAEKKSLTVKLAIAQIDDLKAYAKFAGASINEVAQEALSYVFGRDAEFKEWKEQQQSAKATPQAEPKPAGKVPPLSTKPAQQPAPVQ